MDKQFASDCHRCQYYAYSSHLICAVHPDGIESDRCPDFLLDPNFVELWSPIGFTFIDEQLVTKPIVYPVDFQPTLERSQQWEIFNSHPYFTGVCPQCQNSYPQNIQREIHVHWDCESCGWMDDSVYL